MNALAERLMDTERDFEDIYQEHHRRVFNLCAYLLNSHTAAEDAAHEVFMRAQRRKTPTILHSPFQAGF